MVSVKTMGFFIFATLWTVTTAHLIMQQPVPYSKSTLDNSPLINALPGTAESNFPCKLRTNAFEVTTENYIKVGDSNTISWAGTASHGGGTCQLSVTLDRAPTAKSTFKVIASWIGGCPTSGDGNDGTHPFNWTMPSEVPNGKSTFAWSWVSHLSGQPEYYMNCAPVTVSGGASNTDDFDQLEDLFRVNLPSSYCSSQLSSNLEIPNPGKYVTTFASTALATPTGTGCAALGQASATEGSSTGNQSASSLTSAVETSTAAVVVISSSSSTSTEASSSTLPTAVTASSTASSGTTSGNGTSSATTGTCTTDGAIVCNGSTQFGICNFGEVVWQDVADGTTCSNGAITKRALLSQKHFARHHQGRFS